VSSWAFEPADSIPIGDCDFRILELQLQFGRNCKKGIFAHFLGRNFHTGFVRPHFLRATAHAYHLRTNSIPAPFSSLGALGGMFSRGAVGFVLLDAVSLLWLFGRQEYKNGFSI
jgi:hypothetical protein